MPRVHFCRALLEFVSYTNSMTQTTATTVTYWHIADASYNGGPLVCRDSLARAGNAPAWKWGDDAPDGFDGDVVCLFADTPRGRTEADWLWHEHQAFHLLRVDVPADVHDDVMTTVAEGYPAVRDEIPAEWITHVRAGYDERAIRREGDEY